LGKENYGYWSITFGTSLMKHQKIAEYVEILCQNGCIAVNATIKAMEANQRISAVEGLSQDEKQMVLKELKSIMSVYQSCPAKKINH
jgi:hypothetical protein